MSLCILWEVSRKERACPHDKSAYPGPETHFRDTSFSSSWSEVDYWAPTCRNLLPRLHAWSFLGFFNLLLPARKIQTAPSSQILRTKSRNETKKESSMFSYERRFTQMCDLSQSKQAGQAWANSPNCDSPPNSRLCLEPTEVHPPLKVTHTNYRRNLSNWPSLFK